MNSNQARKFVNQDDIEQIKTSLDVNVINNFLLNDPSKVVTCIQYWTNRKNAAGVEDQERCKQNIQQLEAILERMLSLTVDVYQVPAIETIDSNPIAQQELPFEAEEETSEEEGAPVINMYGPKEHTEKKAIAWGDFIGELRRRAAKEAYEQIKEYADSILKTGAYQPKKAFNKVKIWKDSEINDLLKNTVKSVKKEESVSSTSPVENKEVSQNTSIMAAEGFTVKEMETIEVLKEVFNLFEIPGTSNSNANGLGVKETRARIKDLIHKKPTIEEENEIINKISNSLKSQIHNAATIDKLKNSKEGTAMDRIQKAIAIVFKYRPYNETDIEQWFETLKSNQENVDYLAILQGTSNETSQEPVSQNEAELESAPIEEAEIVHIVNNKEYSENEYAELLFKMELLGFRDPALKDDFEGYTEEEQLGIFLNTYDDIPTESKIIGIVTKNIHAFFAIEHEQKEIDHCNNAINIFFKDRSYLKRAKQLWRVKAASGASLPSEKEAMDILTLSETELEKMDKEVQEKSKTAAEKAKEEPKTSTSKPHTEDIVLTIEKETTKDRVVKREALVESFTKAIKDNKPVEDHLNAIANKLEKDGAYPDIMQGEKGDSQHGYIHVDDRESFIDIMHIIWNEAKDAMLTETDVVEVTDIVETSDAINSMKDLTKEGYRKLNEESPSYESFISWLEDNLLNKHLLGQKEGVTFTTKEEVLRFAKGTFGTRLPKVTTTTTENTSEKVTSSSETLLTQEEVEAKFVEESHSYPSHAHALKALRSMYIANGITLGENNNVTFPVVAARMHEIISKSKNANKVLLAKKSDSSKQTEEKAVLAGVAKTPTVDTKITWDNLYGIIKAIWDGEMAKPNGNALDTVLAFCMDTMPKLEEAKDWDKNQIASWVKQQFVDVEEKTIDTKKDESAKETSIKSEFNIVRPEFNILTNARNKQDLRVRFIEIFNKFGDTPAIRQEMIAALRQKTCTKYSRQTGNMPEASIHDMLNRAKKGVEVQ